MRSTTSGSVTPSARASRRTMPKPCVGIDSQPSKGTPPPNLASGSGTPSARASRRTRLRPCVGIGSQPSRGTPSTVQPRVQVRSARASRRTMPKPCVGIGSQPSRGTRTRSTASGSGTPSARASRRTMPKVPCVGIALSRQREPPNAQYSLGSTHSTPSGNGPTRTTC